MTGTLGDLKTRIRTDLDRDDMGSGDALETRLNEAIDSAISYWKGRAFSRTEEDVPASDADSNIWTTDRADLIAARTKIILCRGPLRDQEVAAFAEADEKEQAMALLGRGWMETDWVD